MRPFLIYYSCPFATEMAQARSSERRKGVFTRLIPHLAVSLMLTIAGVPLRLLFGDKFTTQTSGGITVYYISPSKGKVTAFKPVGPHVLISIGNGHQCLLPPCRASACSWATP